MSQITFISMQLWSLTAQVPINPEPATPEAASVVFSGPRFFVALISGILLAFAIQLMLTNFSVAAGISYLGRSSNSKDDHSHSDDESGGVGTAMRKISTGVGIWTLITVSVALFFACYLAVQLSLLSSVGLGAIIGLVIWAAYFTLLIWFSSSTVGSLIGSVVNTATSSFQMLLGAATAAIGGQAAKRQAVSTAEAVVDAVKHELGTGIDPVSIRESIEDYVHRLRLPEFNMGQIRQDFEALLNDPEVAELAQNDRLRHIDRQTFVDLVSRRTDFSKQEVNRLADLLQGVWEQTLGRTRRRDSRAELIDYLQSTQPGQLQIQELNAKLDRLLAEQRSQQSGSGSDSSGGWLQNTVQTSMNSMIGLLVGRTDLSDLDLEKVLGKLQKAPTKLSEQASKTMHQIQGSSTAKQAEGPIRVDVDNYLHNTYSWQMTPERVAREFREVLYDPEADPNAVIAQLSSLNRNYFVDALTARGVFTQAKIQQLADQLESIRQEVLATARTAKEREIELDLRERVEIYLTLTPIEQLYSDDTLPAFKSLIEDSDADYTTLQARLAPYNRDTLRQILSQRSEVTPAEAERILTALETTRDRTLAESQSLDEQAKQRLHDTQQRLESYLRNTGKSELNPEGIKRDLQLLFNEPQLGLQALKHRAGQIDRNTIVQLLQQRQDISPEEANQIVNQVESNWNSVVYAPRNITGAVQDNYNQVTTNLANYLRRTNLDELDPEGIQNDLKTLLSDPREGGLALRDRLSKIDRETIVRLLSQREDLSREQVERTVDQVESAIRKIVRSPRRLALRAQQNVVDFETSIEEYLRNTDRDELNPEGIKRDLNLLMQSPKYGLQNLGDRLSRMDRSTLIALLSQRKDMTPEEADRIVSQIESVRDQVLDQVHQVQYRIQSVIDRIFDSIRNYLNSLNRSELDYDGIKRDVRTLFDDPKAGFEALRTRLSHFDRGTLVAILSSRKDISEQDANRIIDQIESARNSVLQRAEAIQTEAQMRLEEIKRETQHQMEETRKAASAAAWWLFITALVSATTSAIGGALAANRLII